MHKVFQNDVKGKSVPVL